MATGADRKPCTLPRDQQLAKSMEWEEKEDLMEAMRRKIMERAGLAPQQAAMVMEAVIKGVRGTLQVANRKGEEDRCWRTNLIHNADKWVGNLNNNFSLTEHIMAKIQ